MAQVFAKAFEFPQTHKSIENGVATTSFSNMIYKKPRVTLNTSLFRQEKSHLEKNIDDAAKR